MDRLNDSQASDFESSSQTVGVIREHRANFDLGWACSSILVGLPTSYIQLFTHSTPSKECKDNYLKNDDICPRADTGEH